jgi:LPXTG-motif cell wall-anchored protein
MATGRAACRSTISPTAPIPLNLPGGRACWLDRSNSASTKCSVQMGVSDVTRLPRYWRGYAYPCPSPRASSGCFGARLVRELGTGAEFDGQQGADCGQGGVFGRGRCIGSLDHRGWAERREGGRWRRAHRRGRSEPGDDAGLTQARPSFVFTVVAAAAPAAAPKAPAVIAPAHLPSTGGVPVIPAALSGLVLAGLGLALRRRVG